MEQSGQQYDEASTIFSPDGRLYQVEYAREAVKKGSTTMGFKWNDGVLLLAHKPETSRLVNLRSLEKIYQIDTHIACVATGLVADGRHLVEIAREEAQWNKVRYDEPISVKELVNILCEYKHMYTQFDGTDISLHQALELGFQTMKKITKPKFNAEMVEAAVIDEKTGYYKLSDEMLKKLVEKHSSE
ncbi:MAG: hypothetical protein NTY91_07275 [Euryarchaeota archaeon]|nr:hypothetical protein [Euryarchaeota archaeon]